MGSFCSERSFQSLDVAVANATNSHDSTRQKVDLAASVLQDVGLLNRSGEFCFASSTALIASLSIHNSSFKGHERDCAAFCRLVWACLRFSAVAFDKAVEVSQNAFCNEQFLIRLVDEIQSKATRFRQSPLCWDCSLHWVLCSLADEVDVIKWVKKWEVSNYFGIDFRIENGEVISL